MKLTLSAHMIATASGVTHTCVFKCTRARSLFLSGGDASDFWRAWARCAVSRARARVKEAVAAVNRRRRRHEKGKEKLRALAREHSSRSFAGDVVFKPGEIAGPGVWLLLLLLLTLREKREEATSHARTRARTNRREGRVPAVAAVIVVVVAVVG